MKWLSSAGESFVISQSTDLKDWVELEKGYPSGGEETTLEISLPKPVPSRFFLKIGRE